MPKQYETNSLGFKLKFNGPESVEAYDQKAGRKDATLEDAIDNTIYRGTLPEWQDAFAKKIEETIPGAKRGTDEKATEKAKARAKDPSKVDPVPEKVKAFVARLQSTMSDADKASLAALAQEVANGIEIDPSPSKRQAGPNKELLAKADSLLQLPPDQLQAKIDTFVAAVGGEVEADEENEGKPTRESLARLVGRFVQHQLDQV